jgi:hypothetical protein
VVDFGDLCGDCTGEALDCREEAALADTTLAEEATLVDEDTGASGSTGRGMTGDCELDGGRGCSEAL